MTESPPQKLQRLLSELFQFDSADLDFGIYRIMNLRREGLNGSVEKDEVKHRSDHSAGT